MFDNDGNYSNTVMYTGLSYFVIYGLSLEVIIQNDKLELDIMLISSKWNSS